MSGSTTENKCQGPETDSKQPQATATTEYCAQLQRWMWGYYCGGAALWYNWSVLQLGSSPPPVDGAPTPGSDRTTSGGRQQGFDSPTWSTFPFAAVGAHLEQSSTRTSATVGRPPQQQQQGGSPPPAGQEYTIPSPLQRFLAETVDFFILFCVKATMVLWIMHLSGMKDIAKCITQFIVEEIDENASMEDLQKMMLVALVYRVLVCIYETVCIWGAGGATPGKFLLGLRVVTCDTSTPVQPNHVLVVPASNVSLYASIVRALNKNFPTAFLFPVFITLLFFQHNRTVYDMAAGTIVVQRRGGR